MAMYERVGIAADIENRELVRFRDQNSMFEDLGVYGGYKFQGRVSPK